MLCAIVFLPMLLVGFTAAAPSPLSPRQDSCGGDKSIAGYCTPLTYTDQTNSSSIPATACQHTCQSILTDAGDWGVDFTGQPAGYRDEMFLGTCGFGIARETDADTSQYSFSVANQDILDIIDESIKMFADKHGAKVKAEGTMNCEGHVVRWFVG
ncbi:putative necrosis-inducing factor-domain-containing protein [Jackrogersella minutella]|nr:putative necrosis-inducing factor-domain-containing protein [Jackrogersella minutella]